MYLTKLNMDIAHPSARAALINRQDLHRNLMQAFEKGRQEESVLYRLVEKKNGIQVIVLSTAEPERTALQNRGMTVEAVTDLSNLPRLYGNGASFHFNLFAVPSKKISEEGVKNSRRVFLKEPGARMEWLKKQGIKYGFEVLECHEPSAIKKISVIRKGGAFDFVAVELEGTVRITDGELFWPAWQNGIGPEKAYGTGLMLLSK